MVRLLLDLDKALMFPWVKSLVVVNEPPSLPILHQDAFHLFNEVISTTVHKLCPFISRGEGSRAHHHGWYHDI